MKDALLLVDVLSDFGHDDGERLARAFAERLPALAALIADARERGLPVIYANDHLGDWTADRESLVERARRAAPSGRSIESILPARGDPLVIKPRYSAFDHTAVQLLLAELETERILLAGCALEMCVAQTAIDARELGFKVTILTDACLTVDSDRERTALRYAREIGGIFLEPQVDLARSR